MTSMSFLYTTIGKILISLLTALCGYIILKKQHPDINDTLAAICMFILIGFIIGSSFMSIYSKVSDAIILVYAVDAEINRIHGGK